MLPKTIKQICIGIFLCVCICGCRSLRLTNPIEQNFLANPQLLIWGRHSLPIMGPIIACLSIPSWSRWIQPTPSHSKSLKLILILPSHPVVLIDFQHLEQAITIATPNKSYEFGGGEALFIKFLCIWLNNSIFLMQKTEFCHLKYSFAAQLPCLCLDPQRNLINSDYMNTILYAFLILCSNKQTGTQLN